MTHAHIMNCQPFWPMTTVALQRTVRHVASAQPCCVMRTELHIWLQNGWNVSTVVGLWHVAVNMVNIADLLLHVMYTTVLWRGLASSGAASAWWQQASAVAFAGTALAVLLAQWLPKYQHSQSANLIV